MKRSGWIVVGVVVGVWLLLLAALGVIAAAAVRRSSSGQWDERLIEGRGRNKIVVVHIDGQIHGGESPGGLFSPGGAGAADITSQLRQAVEDDDVAGVLLRIDSPGGAVVASDEIAREVQRVRNQKPVAASMGDLAASGGYYIASQAETVVANPASVTGSIGVIAILPNLEGTASKLGVKPLVLKSGRLKDAGSPFRSMTPRERDLYQRLLDEAHKQFIDSVATGRRMERDKVRDLADGRPYSGLQAHENGLVDKLGDLETAYDSVLDLAKLTRRTAKLVEYRPRRGFADLFPFGSRSLVDEVKRELGLDLGLQYLYLP